MPTIAFAFTNVGAPMSTQFNETTPVGRKSGKASAMSVLGLVAWGDASTEAAARQGNLSTIHHADYSFLNVLGIFTQFTTIVHGE